MSQAIDNAKRGFLKWICRLTGGYLFLSLSPAPLKRVNATLFSEAHGQTACKTDTCTTRDACEGDSVGHTCSVKDVCDADESGDCTNDTCTSDRSLTCNTDSCVSDKSGDCINDSCASDSSGGCKNDTCETDSSGYCEADQCGSDSSGACTNDTCKSDASGACTNDTCESDALGACTNDSCAADSSGECQSDTCVSDKSGACTNDSCTSDKSGACTTDFCLSDSSKACQTDWCRSDSSGVCTNDSCRSDSSGDCVNDTCDSDATGYCESDTCISDSSGDCGVDHCYQDASGPCAVRDICIIDKSGSCDVDLCRQDSSLDCTTSDTCALDMVTGMMTKRQTLAVKGLNRAMKWLYKISTIILIILTGAFAQAQDVPIVIDATNAMFFPAPAFTTSANVTINAPVGPFLRDCDGDGILEADTNGDGQCAGDPKVMDHRGIGTRELPPGTPFTGSFEFTCFYIPDDVAIIATGPLTIKASREVAIFGAMRLSGGAYISTPVDIYAITSAWLSDAGNITITSAMSGEVYTTQLGFADGESVPKISFVSTCDVTGTAVRAIIPPEVAQGSIVTIKGSNLGTVKGKVALGTVKAKVKTWTPELITAEFKKVPIVPGPYASVVTPKKASPITTDNAYQVKAPTILSVIPDGGWAGDTVTLQGKFFGKKKGKLTLGGKKCKVTSWTMDARTGASEVKFVVPAGLDDWFHDLVLTNKVGSSSTEFEVYAPLEE